MEAGAISGWRLISRWIIVSTEWCSASSISTVNWNRQDKGLRARRPLHSSENLVHHIERTGRVAEAEYPFRGHNCAESPIRRRKFRHGFGLKELATLPRDETRRGLRLFAARTVGRDPCTGIHLSIELRNKDKRKPRFERRRAVRALPDRVPIVEAIPNTLRTLTDLCGTHERMGGEHLGTILDWNEPVARDRHSVHIERVDEFLFFPAIEIDRTRKRGHHYE